ncbi:MAG: BrnT family toxin [bacterium]|nr:BrnT family toxin [bacterium]
MNWKKIEGFEWDEGNKEKNWKKHKVTMKETEEVFLNKPQSVFEDTKHSTKEKRYIIVGKNNFGRLLIVFFTLRKNKIRIISARDQGRTERKKYEKNKTYS